MKDYAVENPVFHDKIKIVDTDDPDHADYISLADRQNFENILVLKQNIEEIQLADALEIESMARVLMESSGIPGVDEDVRTATENEVNDVIAGIEQILD